MGNGQHAKGIATGISRRLQQSIVKVTPVCEYIMQLKLNHILGFMFVVAVYAPNEV